MKLLPHLNTVLYSWQRKFIESKNRMNLCTAANQIGKSTMMIIKNILWATETDLWEQLWPEAMAHDRPITQFWYFYPDAKTANREFKQKWVKEWLPRGEYKESGKYAWKAYFKQKDIERIEFIDSGVTIYFFTYGQGSEVAQASTVYMVTVDEELPFKKFFSELIARISNTKGYFNAGFTATVGQDEWRRAMEETGPYELFPEAFKMQISLYDCQFKEDGSIGMWPEEKIKRQIQMYGTKNEVLKRAYGKFVKDSGLVFPAFDRVKNVVHLSKQKKLPKDWLTIVGIDLGSGGDKGHPSSICFLKTNPGFTRGYVFKLWRGDGVQTTATDVLEKYREMKKGENVVACYYDWSSAEFGTVASRAGEAVQPANKSREEGTTIINTLFRNEMLKIYEDEESIKLINELNSLDVDTKKTKARDDAIDAMRYAVMGIDWDFSCINAPEPEKKDELDLLDPRQKFIALQKMGKNPDYVQDLDDQVQSVVGELQEWEDYLVDSTDDFYED
jgi:hypothetical protein